MSVIPAAAVPDAELATAYVIFLASYLVFSIGKFPGLKVDRPAAAIIGQSFRGGSEESVGCVAAIRGAGLSSCSAHIMSGNS